MPARVGPFIFAAAVNIASAHSNVHLMGAWEPWLCQKVLSWWTLKQRTSRLCSLSRGTIISAVYPGEGTKHGSALRLFPTGKWEVLLP